MIVHFRSQLRLAIQALPAVFVAMAIAGFADAQTGVAKAEGDWVAELHVPQGVRLAFHIRDTGDGGLTGAVDSPDQSVTGMPIDIRREGDHMTLSTPSGGGQRLDLDWDAASAGWSGDYVSSAGQFPIMLTRGVVKPWPKIDRLDGDWQATASYETNTLHLALHIASTAETTQATLTSPEAAGLELPVGQITRDGDHVAFEIPGLRGSFTGALSADGKTLTGTYTQSNLQAPVAFERK